jgi:Flp pilus assembly pilin Flp
LDGAASRAAPKVVHFLLDQSGATAGIAAAIVVMVAGPGAGLNTTFGSVQTALK